MGRGVNLTIYNGTRYQFYKRDQGSNQMNQWNLPTTINPDGLEGCYVEWNESIGKNPIYDGGEAFYNIVGTRYTFQVHARFNNGPIINLHLDGMSTLSESQGAHIEIDYRPNGDTYPYKDSMCLIISGEEGKFVSNSRRYLNDPWMQINLPTLGRRSLRQLCMPASHDSGMSEVGKGTIGGTPYYVQTQTKNIGQQLDLGVRFFDIRPVISGNHFYTGHYGTAPVIGWQGANGQKLDAVIDQINRFTRSSAELVILKVSHAINTDENYRDFNEGEWNRLHSEFRSLDQDRLYKAPPGTTDLTNLTLNQYIGGNKAAVVVIFPDLSNNKLGNWNGQGFYYDTAFPMYDKYANTDDPGKMIDDQKRKLKEERTSPTSWVFSLDWNLTQQGLTPSVLELAARANSWLLESVRPIYDRRVFPNLISMDDVKNTSPVALTTAINTYMSRLLESSSEDTKVLNWVDVEESNDPAKTETGKGDNTEVKINASDDAKVTSVVEVKELDITA